MIVGITGTQFSPVFFFTEFQFKFSLKIPIKNTFNTVEQIHLVVCSI